MKYSLERANVPYESHQIDDETLYLCSALKYEWLCLRRLITCECEGNLFTVIAWDKSAGGDIELDWLSRGQTEPLFSSQMIAVIFYNEHPGAGGAWKYTKGCFLRLLWSVCCYAKPDLCVWLFSRIYIQSDCLFHTWRILKVLRVKNDNLQS